MNKMLFTWSVAIVSVVLAVESAQAQSPTDSYTFRSQRAVGCMDQIEAALDLSGDQKVVEDSKVQRYKTSVLANLLYHERTLELASDGKLASRSIRYYDKASAAIQVGSEAMKPALRDERRLVGVSIEGEKVVLFSPRGSLTREELDLVDLLGNSLLVDRLLPDKPVRVGDKWEHSRELLTVLLGLDAVSEVDASSTLLTVTDDRARFEMNGRVSGAVGGVTTEIELKAKYHFDRKANRVSWFGLLVKENRSVGHIGPGLEVTARLQMKIVPGSQATSLTDESLVGLPLKPTPELIQLTYESPQGGWMFLHDRQWYVTADDPKQAVLRMVDQGEFVAQCKISSMPNATGTKELTLPAFQEDIKHGLDKSFKQFVEAGQSANEHGYRVYRVVVEGEASDLPIRWIYYYVADKYGRQVVLAFTVEGRLMEAFGKSDERLLSALNLTDAKMAAKPSGK